MKHYFKKLTNSGNVVVTTDSPDFIRVYTVIPKIQTNNDGNITIKDDVLGDLVFNYTEAYDKDSNTSLGATQILVETTLADNYFFKSANSSGTGSVGDINAFPEKTVPLALVDAIPIYDSVTGSNKKVLLGSFKTTILGWLPSFMTYQSAWNASTNTPTLVSPDLTKAGYVYRCSVAGTQFGLSFNVGDWLIYNSSGVAELADNSDVTLTQLGLDVLSSPEWADVNITSLGTFNGSSNKSVKSYINKLGDALSNYGYSPNFQFLNQKGTAGSDTPTLGSELLTSSEWTSTGWTGSFASGWTHSTGNTSVLSNTLAAVIGNRYYIAFTVTGRTTGSFTVTFGGQSQSANTSTGFFVLLTTSTAALQITPTSDFDGKIVISVKQITAQTVATQSFYSSDGTLVNEIRVSNKLISLFYGLNSGSYNYGINNSGFGVNCFQNNINGTSNSGFATNCFRNNVNGSSNSGFGTNCFQNNTNGSNNSGFGTNCFLNTINGSNNSGFGRDAGRYISDGSTSLTTANNSTFIGYGTKASANSVTNENVFGYNAIGIGSNTVMLGDSTVTITATYGKIGAGLINPTAVLHLKAGGTAAGSAPLKFTTQSAGLTSIEQGVFELIGNSLQFSKLVKRRSIVMGQAVLISDTSVNNTITESSALITAQHGAGYLEAGFREKIELLGTISQRNNAAAFGSFRIKYAGVTIQTISTPAATTIAAGTPYKLEVSTTVRSTGTSGTIHIHGLLLVSGIAIADFGVITTASIDTTTAQNTTVTFIWNEANAADLMTVNQGSVVCIDGDR